MAFLTFNCSKIFLCVLFSCFTSEMKTGMECHTCFTVLFRSVCVDNHRKQHCLSLCLMSQKGKISHIWMSCVLASTKYLAWEHRTHALRKKTIHAIYGLGCKGAYTAGLYVFVEYA